METVERMGPVDAVVLCGGRGTRLGSLTATMPKPLLPVGTHPFLYYTLVELQRQGITRVILAARYLAEQFEAFIASYTGILPAMELVVEPAPLGTGGALRHAAGFVQTDRCVVLNGDSQVLQPLAPVLQFHEHHHSAFTLVAVQASRVLGGARAKGVLERAADGRLLGFRTEPSSLEGWVNAGMYVMERAAVASWPAGAYDLESRLSELLGARRGMVFCSDASLLDIGTPDLYQQAEHLIAALHEGVASA